MWTEEQIIFLEKNYRTLPKEEVAKYLDKSLSTINRKARLLNLTKPYRIWSQEELDYLQQHLGRKSVPTIAKKLNRTESSVLTKMSETKNMDTKLSSCYLFVPEITEAFQLSCSKIVINWIKNHGLPAKFTATRISMKTYCIEPKDFWKWAKENKDRIKFDKYVPYSLLPEPDWLQGAIKESIRNREKEYSFK